MNTLFTAPQDALTRAGGLVSSFISASSAEACELLGSLYGLGGRVTRYATEKDDTFKVDADDGRKFILKIANPDEDLSELDFELSYLRHLQTAAPSLPVPRVFADRAGQWLTPYQDAAGQKRHVRLLSYLEGTLLDHTNSSAVEREQVGRVLGRLRHASATFSHPADGRVLAWDVQHLRRVEHLLGEVDDIERRFKLNECLQRFLAIEPEIRTLRSQVLHNDFNPSNILVAHESPGFVVGIIDFGDAVRTAVAIDVATALHNQLPKAAFRLNADIFRDGRDLLRGYLQVAELDDKELRLIPLLVMGRIVLRALLTLWRARLFPENSAYILRHTEPGWRHLEWFLRRGNAEIMQSLMQVNE